MQVVAAAEAMGPGAVATAAAVGTGTGAMEGATVLTQGAMAATGVGIALAGTKAGAGVAMGQQLGVMEEAMEEVGTGEVTAAMGPWAVVMGEGMGEERMGEGMVQAGVMERAATAPGLQGDMEAGVTDKGRDLTGEVTAMLMGMGEEGMGVTGVGALGLMGAHMVVAVVRVGMRARREGEALVGTVGEVRVGQAVGVDATTLMEGPRCALEAW